jgi:hypothetical protein
VSVWMGSVLESGVTARQRREAPFSFTENPPNSEY